MVKPLRFKSMTTIEGHIFPAMVKVGIGQDIVFQLLTLPINFNECLLTNPDRSKVYKIKPGISDGRYVLQCIIILIILNKYCRIMYWNPANLPSGCGVRIKKITVNDWGRWKLEAKSPQNKTYKSFVKVNVLSE